VTDNNTRIKKIEITVHFHTPALSNRMLHLHLQLSYHMCTRSPLVPTGYIVVRPFSRYPGAIAWISPGCHEMISPVSQATCEQ
jgi:hypothetical protein